MIVFQSFQVLTPAFLVGRSPHSIISGCYMGHISLTFWHKLIIDYLLISCADFKWKANGACLFTCSLSIRSKWTALWTIETADNFVRFAFFYPVFRISEQWKIAYCPLSLVPEHNPRLQKFTGNLFFPIPIWGIFPLLWRSVLLGRKWIIRWTVETAICQVRWSVRRIISIYGLSSHPPIPGPFLELLLTLLLNVQFYWLQNSTLRRTRLSKKWIASHHISQGD